jgi:hypothetical protein
LLEHKESLLAAINAKSESRLRLLSGQHSEPQLAALDREIRDLVAQYQELEEQTKIGGAAPVSFLGAQEVQRLLDTDTLLLEYSLGDRRSYVFAVGPDSIEAHELPKRSQIEAASRRLYESLTAGGRNIQAGGPQGRNGRSADGEANYAKAAGELSQMVLGPLAAELGSKRLLVVSDGGLEYIPRR